METKWLRVSAAPDDPEGLERDPAVVEAAAYLRKGELVAFPTETVYGLGGNALDPRAVAKIYEAKGRPPDNPLIVHLADAAQLAAVARSVPKAARRLIDAFWPGPLTLVLPKREGVPLRTTGGLDTVAVRMPAHPAALALLRLAEVPVAAPSANRSGRPSPTTAAHVWEDLAGRIPVLLDGGAATVGVESTVVDVGGDRPVILRPGGIGPEELAEVLGTEVELDPSWSEPVERPKAPGMKYRHYAPEGTLYLVVGDVAAARREILRRAEAERKAGRKVGILTTEEGRSWYPAPFYAVACGRREDLSSVAAALFAALREFDRAGCDVIFAEPFPAAGVGWAVVNRLLKAAGHRVIRV